MTIADRIREKRISLDLSQTDLAKRAGYSDRTTISKFEHMGNEITMKQIRRVAKALGVSPAYLMGWEDFENDVAEGKIEQSEIEKALMLYDRYMNSKQEVQGMVDYLLKTGADSAVVIETTRQD